MEMRGRLTIWQATKRAIFMAQPALTVLTGMVTFSNSSHQTEGGRTPHFTTFALFTRAMTALYQLAV